MYERRVTEEKNEHSGYRGGTWRAGRKGRGEKSGMRKKIKKNKYRRNGLL